MLLMFLSSVIYIVVTVLILNWVFRPWKRRYRKYIIEAKLNIPLAIESEKVIPIGTKLSKDPISKIWSVRYKFPDETVYTHEVTTEFLRFNDMYEISEMEGSCF